MKTIQIFLSALLIISIASFNNPEIKTIRGKVTSADDNSALSGVLVLVKGISSQTRTDNKGSYEIKVPEDRKVLVFALVGYQTSELSIGTSKVLDVSLQAANYPLQKASIALQGKLSGMAVRNSAASLASYKRHEANGMNFNTESYTSLNENRFLEVRQNPLSTFSTDVDAASYSNVRRFINSGQLPPVDAVRIEEMINYFDYAYPQPANGSPVSISTELTTAPWNPKHHLVKIGLQAKTITYDKLPSSNFVFIIDVSGSMESPNKLPLLKSSIRLLTDQLRPNDKVSIVVYAGAAGQILKPTSGEHKQTIKDALEKLQAGGSTAGGAGINLAYKLAEENFIKGGNNRIILATDGDFNIGASSDGEMQRLIEEKRKSGVYFTVLGFGMGNYKDSKMEVLANKGNGNFAYIDNISEARKVLITEFGGTLFTVAKDVKLQVEFNPAKVGAYRLIGYENRMLNKEDFNNDQKDAGDMGSGHRVTALYELIPAGLKSSFIGTVDELKYQHTNSSGKTPTTDELMNIKLRYKDPDQDDSRLISQVVSPKITPWNNSSSDLRFTTAVAGFGMLLRNSEFKQNTDYRSVINWAESGLGSDKEGYRSEFIRLVRSSELMAKDLLSVKEKMIMDSSR